MVASPYHSRLHLYCKLCNASLNSENELTHTYTSIITILERIVKEKKTRAKTIHLWRTTQKLKLKTDENFQAWAKGKVMHYAKVTAWKIVAFSSSLSDVATVATRWRVNQDWWLLGATESFHPRHPAPIKRNGRNVTLFLYPLCVNYICLSVS